MKHVYGAALAAAVSSVATADFVGVVGGQTNVLLDFALIEEATGLALEGVSDGVIVPGNLGPDSVAFAITSTSSANLPTTFNYDSDDFENTFNGSIEHRGSVSFNGSADVTVGNFTVGYDAAYGFQVIDNLDLQLALFDVVIAEATPGVDTFEVTGDLQISQAFATALLELGLAGVDLTGVDVGDTFIQGFNQAVPSPGVMAVGVIAGLAARRRRRS